MNKNRDIKLEYQFTDRAGRGVYGVRIRGECSECGHTHWKPTGQQIRFDLDGNHHIKVDNVLFGD